MRVARAVVDVMRRVLRAARRRRVREGEQRRRRAGRRSASRALGRAASASSPSNRSTICGSRPPPTPLDSTRSASIRVVRFDHAVLDRELRAGRCRRSTRSSAPGSEDPRGRLGRRDRGAERVAVARRGRRHPLGGERRHRRGRGRCGPSRPHRDVRRPQGRRGAPARSRAGGRRPGRGHRIPLGPDRGRRCS